MIENVRKFLAEKKPEIVAAGLTISVAGSAIASQAFGADATSDTMNSTFQMLGSMMDSFATLVPHFINLIVAFIPLAILGAILGAVLMLIYKLPQFIKLDIGTERKK